MRILLTNDDGLDSPGLQRLREALRRDHETWVIAPAVNRSGSSHSVHLNEAIKVQAVSDRVFSCQGTPADCIIIACLGLIPERIDMIISGINIGPNLGTDIVYSGTAAAARQGAFRGIPSIACSLNAFSPPYHLKYPVSFITKNLETFHSLWAEDHFLNINFPHHCSSESIPVITFPSRRIYKDELFRFQAPQGDLYCIIGGAAPESETERGSDYWVVEEGHISLSPIVIHPANHEIEERYQRALFQR